MLFVSHRSAGAGTALMVLCVAGCPGEAVGSAHTVIALHLIATVLAPLLRHTATCLSVHTAGGRLCNGANSCLFLMLSTFARTWFCLVGLPGKYLWGWKIYQDCGTVITEK